MLYRKAILKDAIPEVCSHTWRWRHKVLCTCPYACAQCPAVSRPCPSGGPMVGDLRWGVVPPRGAGWCPWGPSSVAFGPYLTLPNARARAGGTSSGHLFWTSPGWCTLFYLLTYLSMYPPCAILPHDVNEHTWNMCSCHVPLLRAYPLYTVYMPYPAPQECTPIMDVYPLIRVLT